MVTILDKDCADEEALGYVLDTLANIYYFETLIP